MTGTNKHYVIYAASEAQGEEDIALGVYWSQTDGWVSPETATRFTSEALWEKTPLSKASDAVWIDAVLLDEALQWAGDRKAESQTEAAMLATIVAGRLGFPPLRWLPSTSLEWKYAEVDLNTSRPLSIGISSGGVVSVNGDPFTPGDRRMNVTLGTVQTSIATAAQKMRHSSEEALPFNVKVSGTPPAATITSTLASEFADQNGQPSVAGRAISDFAEAFLLRLHCAGLNVHDPRFARALSETVEDFAYNRMSEYPQPYAQIASDLAASLTSACEQIGQMKGMFNDEDGTIAESLEAAASAQWAYRQVCMGRGNPGYTPPWQRAIVDGLQGTESLARRAAEEITGRLAELSPGQDLDVATEDLHWELIDEFKARAGVAAANDETDDGDDQETAMEAAERWVTEQFGQGDLRTDIAIAIYLDGPAAGIARIREVVGITDRLDSEDTLSSNQTMKA